MSRRVLCNVYSIVIKRWTFLNRLKKFFILWNSGQKLNLGSAAPVPVKNRLWDADELWSLVNFLSWSKSNTKSHHQGYHQEERHDDKTATNILHTSEGFAINKTVSDMWIISYISYNNNCMQSQQIGLYNDWNIFYTKLKGFNSISELYCNRVSLVIWDHTVLPVTRHK